MTHRSEGRSYVYLPTRSRDQAGTSTLRTFIDRVFRGDPLLLFQRLLEDEELSPQDLSALKEMIDKKRRRGIAMRDRPPREDGLPASPTPRTIVARSHVRTRMGTGRRPARRCPGRRGLVGRLTHILDGPPSEPTTGRRWAFATACLTMMAAVGLAPVQVPEMNRSGRNRGESNSVSLIREECLGSRREADSRRTVWGDVRDTAGKPVVGESIRRRFRRSAL